MAGVIVQVNVSPGGLPKVPIREGFITPLGLDNDAHAHPQFHGGPRKAILLIAAETVDYLAARGYPVFFGALGENLTTRGLAVRDLRIGDRIRAGAAVLELTQPRVPCSQIEIYGPAIGAELYDRRVKALEQGSPRWGLSGFYASVLEPGPVRAGDIIAVEGTLA